MMFFVSDSSCLLVVILINNKKALSKSICSYAMVVQFHVMDNWRNMIPWKLVCLSSTSLTTMLKGQTAFLPSDLILCSITEKWFRSLCPSLLWKVELHMCSPNQQSLLPVCPMLDDLIQMEFEQPGNLWLKTKKYLSWGTEHGVDLTV